MAAAASPVPASGSSTGSVGAAGDDLDFVSNQFDSIDIHSDAGVLNINAYEFVPKTNLSIGATEFVPGFSSDVGGMESMQEESEDQVYLDHVDIVYVIPKSKYL